MMNEKDLEAFDGKDIYQILTENGVKVIIFIGYAYATDACDGVNPAGEYDEDWRYRFKHYNHEKMPLSEFLTCNKEVFFEKCDTNSKVLEDYNEEGIIKLLESLQFTCLPYNEISFDTPDGTYISLPEKGRSWHIYKGRTAEEVVDMVKRHCLSTSTDDINDLADVFGHTSVKELEELAKKETDTFFLIANHIWDFERVVCFYNSTVNEAYIALSASHSELKVKFATETGKIPVMTARLEQNQKEIMRLKSKIFDLQELVNTYKGLYDEKTDLSQVYCKVDRSTGTILANNGFPVYESPLEAFADAESEYRVNEYLKVNDIHPSYDDYKAFCTEAKKQILDYLTTSENALNYDSLDNIVKKVGYRQIRREQK